VHVKICGIRTVEAALEAVKAGADFIGVNFVPGAKRAASHEVALAISEAVRATSKSSEASVKLPIATSAATDFFSLTSQNLKTSRTQVVGIFQNQPLSEVLEKQRLYNLDLVQLHGEEPIEWAKAIPVPVIRCFKPNHPAVGLRGYHVVPLLDSGAGSGKLLDVSNVKELLQKDPDLRIFLAGGLNPDNVAEVVNALGEFSSQVIGVDVSSGVEEDGKQSLAKINAFVNAGKAIR
jgi:anthranilate synthase/indole-3-glycerol phosphate synthase/phosphoribosylanthranilate isomerase